ncbi:LLM class flavin-dependent oxidoreductase [Kineococcus sp. SYSU DK003]|uniref:LLM class flavin-dependent oxidoreductase n=1 Tax=Kineococcus sp. SYSU DK003 TaxID=3383124 RepID=UPI003D7D3DD4
MSDVPALSCVVLPDNAPAQFLADVREAEQAGVRTVWTYDHLSWRSLRGGPWFGMVPLLSAAAVTTSTVRLGVQVATPNFRHPVPFAQEVMTLDHLSGGRFDLGVGAGARDSDAVVLGQPELSLRERADRFGEWTTVLRDALAGGRTSFTGTYYDVREAVTEPGCVQSPTVPFTVAATGPRGMRLAARIGTSWVTYGPFGVEQSSPLDWVSQVAAQTEAFGRVEAEVRPRRRIRRIVQIGLDQREFFTDADTYAEVLAGLTAAGFDEVTVHWPRPDGRGVPRGALERVVELHAAAR